MDSKPNKTAVDESELESDLAIDEETAEQVTGGSRAYFNRADNNRADHVRREAGPPAWR